ncbi:WD40/YVTN/BNR-like repeat-containing protein [Sorangium sp. So ce1097]|uniref:WD40/YVTN/BNR-like repeat-containing protein n=1 Tax=Sorangium sp. So ce1097 TaxID=3133330 RepID=UPI003F5E1AD2
MPSAFAPVSTLASAPARVLARAPARRPGPRPARAALRITAALAALAALPSPAAANGVFPSADQIVFDPADPARAVARMTYGVLTTRDGGASWRWICEGAVGYDDTVGQAPPIAAAAGGRVLAALDDGLAVGTEGGCAWTGAAELAGQAVVDLSVRQGDPSHVVAVAAGDRPTLWASRDGGASWASVGAPLPAGFLARTVDIAPSDPRRVYVSGLASGAGPVKGVLARSLDGGETWETAAVPGSTTAREPYIAGVDPRDADVLYVRIASAPGRLFASTDGGATFAPVFETQGFVRAFAISPDGAAVAVGSDVDGVFRAPSSTLAFERVSGVAPRCFTWTETGLYACASEFLDGFTIGRSLDGGATFEPLLRQACIRGPLECAASTRVGARCATDWPRIALMTGHNECAPDAGSPGAGASEASGTGGATAGSGGGDGAGAGGAPDVPGGGAAPSVAGGCGCRAAGGAGAGWARVMAAAGLAATAVARRRRRGAARGGPDRSAIEIAAPEAAPGGRDVPAPPREGGSSRSAIEIAPQ